MYMIVKRADKRIKIRETVEELNETNKKIAIELQKINKPLKIGLKNLLFLKYCFFSIIILSMI